jgi:hypothetical protein
MSSTIEDNGEDRFANGVGNRDLRVLRARSLLRRSGRPAIAESLIAQPPCV